MRINHLTPGLQNAPELYIFNVRRMKTNETMEDRLWDYIDGLSSPAERSAIEILIADNLEWRRKYQELLDVHRLMAGSELDQPSMRFTKNVMEEIARFQVAPATKNYINKNIIRGVGAFFITLITGIVIYCFGQFKWSWSSSGTSFSPTLTTYTETLDKFNWSRILNSPAVILFMLVAIILSFVLLDMYLQRKKHQAI